MGTVVGQGSDTRDGVELRRVRFAGASIDVAPTLGCCIASWQAGGVERIALPAPLADFARAARTGGVPLLYPWANRLRGDRYRVDDTAVDLSSEPGLKRDENGLPIHGLLLRWNRWDELTVEADDRAATFRATLVWDRSCPQFAAFPFAHVLRLRFALAAESLEIATRIECVDAPVPIAFGWHPYLRVAGSRERAMVELPARAPVRLDSTMLPVRSAGAIGCDAGEPSTIVPIPARRTDLLFAVASPCRAVVASGDSRLVLELLSGWRFLQFFAPADSPYVCLEPMTAPAAALSDGADLARATRDAPFEAIFRLSIESAPAARG